MAKVLSFKEHDIGGLNVKRILPNPEKRMVCLLYTSDAADD